MPDKSAEITILYTSDLHGHAMPVAYETNEHDNHGLATYATAVKQVREKTKNVIVLDNGDLIQGTPFMTHYVKEHADQTNPMVHLMNQIGIDAAVLGNHEFNFGKNILADAIASSDFPWLSANILDKQTGEPAFGSPYVVKTVEDDLKVAILGVTTHYIPNWESPSHIEGYEFADAFTTVKEWIPYIHETEQPDVLIVSYHGGFERDLKTGEPTENLTGENQAYQMCAEIEGIDVLLTGHQHRTFTDEINGVLVIQPGNNGMRYGDIQLCLVKRDGAWSLMNKTAVLHSLEEVEADEEAVKSIQYLETSTQKWLDQPIGYIEGNMLISDPFKARIRKHPFIQLTHTIQKEASGVDISITPLLNNDSTGYQSTVTMRDIVANNMYPNTLVVLEVTGADIIAALEKSAEYFSVDEQGELIVNPTFIKPKPQHYNYDMWDGIDYTINASNELGSRIKHVTYHGKPLDDNENYHIVLNNYRASGGGEFAMFRGKKVIKDIQKDPVELTQAYFEKHKTVQATVVDNFVVKAE